MYIHVYQQGDEEIQNVHAFKYVVIQNVKNKM